MTVLVLLGVLTAPASAQAKAFNFEFAFGWNVDAVAPSGANEVCTVAANCQFGGTGVLGGQYHAFSIGDVATDPVSGSVYVSDPGNLRIQKYDADGNFIAAWGKDVIAGGGTGAEICTVAANCKEGEFSGAGGGFISPRGIDVDGSGYVYVADGTRVHKFTPAGSFLRMWGKDVDSAAGTGPEICTVAANCQPGNYDVEKGGELSPSGIGVTATGDVYVGDAGGRRIQKFNTLGTFQRAWGKDVTVGGSTGFEVCTVAANCKAGVTGTLGGEFGANPASVAADSSGAVYVGDLLNNRIQKFNSSGVFERAWGKDVVSGGSTDAEICIVAANCKAGVAGAQGGDLRAGEVAVDSAGNVYEGGSFRVQQFDASGTFIRAFGTNVFDGGGIGFEICSSATECLGGQSGAPGGFLNRSAGISVDAAGSVYVGEFDARRIQKFSVGPVGTPPQTTIDSGPAGGTDDRTPTFTFSSSAAGSSFECRLEGGSFDPCSGPGASHTPVLDLAEGPHRIQVRAFDPDENVDPTPASRDFIIDSTPPNTSITQGPKRRLETRKRKVRVKVAFQADEDATFECKLDESDYRSCTSPYKAKVKSKGGKGKKHVISIRATDALGNAETEVVRFRVVRKR